MGVIDAARSTPGRVAAAVCGVGLVAIIVRELGLSAVGHALAACAAYFPFVLVLELVILACSTLSLRALYGEAARELPWSQSVRAALIGYAIQGIVPVGRAAAEAARAALLARWVGAGRAGAAAGRMQAVVLLANGLISIPAAIAAAIAVGATWLPLAIAINAVVTLGLGMLLLVVGRRAHVGAWLGRWLKRARAFGVELDAALEHEPVLPIRAIAWESAGRVVQLVQHGLVLFCVAGAVGIVSALCAEGIHVVGAAVGDLIPAQLGAIEGNFTLAADALALSPANAVSIALVVHLAQLGWVIVGAVVPLVWPPKPASPGR